MNKPSRAQNSAKTARGNPDRILPYRWKKGDPSPNPGGRPKSKKLTAAMLALLESELPSGITGAEIVAQAVFDKAKDGDVKAAALIGDRTEGKPPIAIINDGQHKIQVIIDL